MKYSLGLACIVKITHMEGEEIFGSSKQKANLAPRLEGIHIGMIVWIFLTLL